jgi:hypothetical protein
MHPDRLVQLHPHVYHMAEAGTWDSIRARGLMSTSAVLDHFKVSGIERQRIERGHRPTKITVRPDALDGIVLRDQIPMPPDRLLMALGDEAALEAWYATINAKVFFWATEERLHRLLNARHYRQLEHDVLTVNTATLVAAHGPAMWLCHMNSGNTFPMPIRRDASIFKRILDYPVNRNNNPIKDIVEVTVDHLVPDIARHVIEVRRMRGSDVLEKIL